jgi:ABC-type glycerol-3-phosphate transport system substrate-binding protein
MRKCIVALLVVALLCAACGEKYRPADPSYKAVTISAAGFFGGSQSCFMRQEDIDKFQSGELTGRVTIIQTDGSQLTFDSSIIAFLEVPEDGE